MWVIRVLTFSCSLLVLVGVAEQAGPLVQQHQVLVLIDNLQPGPEHREEGVVLPGLVEELVVDVQLEHIPLPQPHVPLGALAVHLHPLEADVLLGQGAGEQGEGLGQPAVQPLPGVVFSDGKLSHRAASRHKIDWISVQYTTSGDGREGGALASSAGIVL